MSASIKSIFLESFQSHERSKLELGGPGQVTIIVGPTDSGKTAIVRALRWLLYNIPQGLDFIQVGKHTATVAIELADGTKIARERSKSVNRYRIAKPGASPVTLEGFGNAVPVEVQELTGVRNVTIGDLELALNLSEQLDGPFLGQKSISGPARAKILGKLAGTEEVDEAQKQVGTDIFRASQEEKRLLSEIEALDAKIKEYDYLPALAKRIASLETLLAQIKSAQDRLTRLTDIRDRLTNIRKQTLQALQTIGRWGGVSEAELIVTAQVEPRLLRHQTLVRCQTSLRQIIQEKTAWESVARRWCNLSLAESAFIEATNGHEKRTRLEDLGKSLDATAVAQIRQESVLRRLIGLSKAEEAVIQASTVNAKITDLLVLRALLADIQNEAAKTRLVVTWWQGLKAAISQIADAEVKTNRLTQIQTLAKHIEQNRQARIVAEAALHKQTQALADAEAQYRNTLISLGKCPLCGSTVNPDLLKEVA